MKRLPRTPVFVVGAVALVVVSFLAVRFGATQIGGRRVLSIVMHAFGLGPASGFRPWESTIVLAVRLPRVATGAFVGAGLALSGGALQGMFRNPLADPGIIGVASGASLGAVAALVLGFAAVHSGAIPAMAVLGAAVAAFTVYGVSSRTGHLPVGTLLLTGIAIGSLTSALTTLLLSLSLEEYEQGRQAFHWLMGGLEARTWSDVALVAPLTLIGSAIVLASCRELDALLVGEAHAVAVGVDVVRVRQRLIVATSMVIGGAVAVSGILAFVGLVVPHILRLLVGPAHSVLLPACLLYGAAFVVGADLLCRTVVAPEEIRLGVMTSTLGAPFFLFLLLSRRKEVSLE